MDHLMYMPIFKCNNKGLCVKPCRAADICILLTYGSKNWVRNVYTEVHVRLD